MLSPGLANLGVALFDLSFPTGHPRKTTIEQITIYQRGNDVERTSDYAYVGWTF